MFAGCYDVRKQAKMVWRRGACRDAYVCMIMFLEYSSIFSLELQNHGHCRAHMEYRMLETILISIEKSRLTTLFL